MAIKSYKMGPGTLKLGPAGIQDVSCQVTNMRVDWSENVKTTDAIDMLCGEVLAAEDDVTHTATLAGNVLQDIDAAGVVAYSWTNKGVSVAFEFIPNTVSARKVTGTVRVVPITLGGDVKTRPRSDISWTIIGTPVLAPTP